MSALRILPAIFSLLALLSLASCKKDDESVDPPPSCTTEGSLLLSHDITTTAPAPAVGNFLHVRYQYDLGRLLRMTDSPARFSTTFTYSANGLEIVGTQVAPGADTTIITYTFSAVGNLTRKTMVSLRNTSLARREDFEYDGGFHLLRRTAYDGPAFANQIGHDEYYWQGGVLTGYSSTTASSAYTHTVEYEYFPDIRGTSISAPLPEADLLFAMGKPYRSFPRNLVRKITYDFNDGMNFGGSTASNAVVDDGRKVLSFKIASWSSAAPIDSGRRTTEYKYECR